MGMYSDMQRSMTEMFDTFGEFIQQITLTVPGSYDPNTGTVATGTEYAFSGYVQGYMAGQTDGSRVKVGDRAITVPNTTDTTQQAAFAQLKPGYHVEIAGEALQEVVSVTDPGTNGLYVVVQIRGIG